MGYLLTFWSRYLIYYSPVMQCMKAWRVSYAKWHRKCNGKNHLAKLYIIGYAHLDIFSNQFIRSFQEAINKTCDALSRCSHANINSI